MGLSDSFKRSFIGGLILLTPLIVSFLVIKLFLDWTSGLTSIVVNLLELGRFTGQDMLLGQLIVLAGSTVVITIVGFVARSRNGRKLLGGFGRMVNLVPMYRTLYFSIKHLANSLVENRSQYKNAVVVEHPDKGVYRLGFTTSKTRSELQVADDQELLNVFIPNSPNPTGGIMALIPEERVHKVDLSVKEAFKTVMTTGISNDKIDNIIPDE
ncbi:MAG: DUF502 domain-containing protein [Candidatus Nanohaloarchaea archaeon]